LFPDLYCSKLEKLLKEEAPTLYAERLQKLAQLGVGGNYTHSSLARISWAALLDSLALQIKQVSKLPHCRSAEDQLGDV
jgi:hypothetical protein